MLKKIEKMLDERFSYPDDIVYYPVDADDIDIFGAVVQIFIDADFPPEDYSVQFDTVFTSPGIDIAVLSVAFVDFGKLYHETFTVESR